MGPELTGTPFRSFFGRPERRFGSFKTTRLMVKLHQAYVLASQGLAELRRGRWGAYSASQTP